MEDKTRNQIKHRLINLRLNNPQITNEAICDAAKISMRTLQRWLSPMDKSLPNIEHIVDLSHTFNWDPGPLFLPNLHIKPPIRPDLSYDEVFFSLGKIAPMMWMDSELNIQYATPAMVTLVDIDNKTLISKNLTELFEYDGTGYDWYPYGKMGANISDSLKVVCDDVGTSSAVVWFVGRSGTAKRFLLRWHSITSGYLMLTLPLDDAYEGVFPSLSSQGGVLHMTLFGKSYPYEMNQYAMRHAYGETIEELADEKYEAKYLREYFSHCARGLSGEDWRDFRQLFIEWLSDEKMFDHLMVLRANV